MSNIVQQAHKLLRKIDETSYNRTARSHEYVCRYFPGSDTFQYGDNTVVLSKDGSQLSLLIRNLTACHRSGSDTDDTDDSYDESESFIEVFFFSPQYENMVRICSTRRMDMYVFGPIDAQCITLIDSLIRASGKVPMGLREPRESEAELIRDYLQNTWPGHLVVCSKHNETESVESFKLKEIREILSQKTTASPQQAGGEQEMIDEPEPVESLACPICICNKKKVALMPCGHCVCFECSKSMHLFLLKRTGQKTCPVCRSPYSIIQRIFL